MEKPEGLSSTGRVPRMMLSEVMKVIEDFKKVEKERDIRTIR